MIPVGIHKMRNQKLSATALNDHALVVKFLSQLPEPQCLAQPINHIYSGLSYERPFWTCHALCRAVAQNGHLALPWQVVDGNFGLPSNIIEPEFPHSWLFHRSTHDDACILDVYPWGSLGNPIIFQIDEKSPWRNLYQPFVFPRHTEDVFQAEAREAHKSWMNATQSMRY